MEGLGNVGRAELHHHPLHRYFDHQCDQYQCEWVGVRIYSLDQYQF